MKKTSMAAAGLGAIFGVAAVGSAIISLEGPAANAPTVSPTTSKAVTTSGA